MKVIAISQRVERIDGIKEVRDALDQRWAVFFQKLKAVIYPVPNYSRGLEGLFSKLKINGVILSGGNDIAVFGSKNLALERDHTENKLVEYAIKKRLPLIGVCRGMQMICHYFGMKLNLVRNHSGVYHIVGFNKLSEPARYFSKFKQVNSYHNYGIFCENVSSDFEIFASHDNVAEGIIHKKFKIAGIMWHPERENPFRIEDSRFLREFLKL